MTTCGYESKVLRLSDGRALGYAEYGPADGPPLLHLHGVPSCRLEALNEADQVLLTGVRLLVLDRPGCGLSDPLPGRRLLDWPADVAGLADALGLDRFALMGVSGGAPYALACALEIPERLSALALVSPCGLLSAPGGFEGVAPLHKLFFALAPARPYAARFLARLAFPLVKQAPGLIVGMPGNLCSADREALRLLPSEVGRLGIMVESGRRGLDGPLEDFRVLGEPWGFQPEEIVMPIQIWHGDADLTIPYRQAEELAGRLPNARLVRCPGQGHFLLAGRFAEILSFLIPGQGAALRPHC